MLKGVPGPGRLQVHGLNLLCGQVDQMPKMLEGFLDHSILTYSKLIGAWPASRAVVLTRVTHARLV